MKISVSQRLIEWYDPQQRDLPWKKTNDPYKIWLSEIILQQTRVEQGRPYYLKFTKSYPSVSDLANARIDDILKLWEGLGYYSRARNLHAAANQVVSEFDGYFPSNYKELLQLKGVGPYTAAAIASFAFGEAVAVVDGNVYRVLSRLFGESVPIDTTAGKKLFADLAGRLIDKVDPGVYNQAIMDLGATVCKPAQPNCETCPFQTDCVARNMDMVKLLPVKSKKLLKKDRYFDFYVITDHRFVAIEKRTSKDIWQGLFQFPMKERTSGLFEMKEGRILPDFAKNFSESALSIDVQGVFRQVLSHQKIEAQFVEIEIPDISKAGLPQHWKVIPINDLFTYAYPKIIHTYLREMPMWLPEINAL